MLQYVFSFQLGYITLNPSNPTYSNICYIFFLSFFLFMYGLYNDGLSSSDCTELNDIIIVNNVLERMKMEVVVA